MAYRTPESCEREKSAMVGLNGCCVQRTENSHVIALLSTVDITVYHGGFHGDLNETFFVGKVDDASKKLVQTAYECMMKGISIG